MMYVYMPGRGWTHGGIFFCHVANVHCKPSHLNISHTLKPEAVSVFICVCVCGFVSVCVCVGVCV